MTRVRQAVPFVVVGGLGVVAAGVLAAATAYTPSFHASWATAYLALVVGFAQVALGVGQALLAPRTLRPSTLFLEILTFNLGHAAVLAGAIADVHRLTDVGGVLLLPPLAWMLWSVRGADRSKSGWTWAYRAVVIVLLVSIPTGLILARFGPG